MKFQDLNPLRKKRRYKMGDEKFLTLEALVEALQEGLSKEIEMREALEAKVEQNSAQPSSESSKEGKTSQVEVSVPEATLSQADPILEHLSAEELVQSFEANKIQDDEKAQRIIAAIHSAGYDIIRHEELIQVNKETEEPEGYVYAPKFDLRVGKA